MSDGKDTNGRGELDERDRMREASGGSATNAKVWCHARVKGKAAGAARSPLAGDITMPRHYEDLASVFKPLARKYRHILYVPGNHEYYKSSPREVARNLAHRAVGSCERCVVAH